MVLSADASGSGASATTYRRTTEEVASDLSVALLDRCSDHRARGRAAEALYGIALDLVARDDAELTPELRRWISEALYSPAGAAADAALRALAEELARALVAAPPAIRAAAMRPPPVSRLDFE